MTTPAEQPATPRSFMVEMSSELLAQLCGEWSEPVQIMVEADPSELGGYRVIARRIEAVAADRAHLATQIEALREAEIHKHRFEYDSGIVAGYDAVLALLQDTP